MSFSFGNTSSSGASNNNTTSTAPASGNLFGAATGSPGFSFGSIGGSAAGNNSTPASNSSSNLFGGQQSGATTQKPAGGLFGGGATASNTTTTPNSSGIFGGGGSTTPATGGLFGGGASTTPAATTAPSSGGMFGGGGAASSTAPASGGLFGNAGSNASKPAAGLFGGGGSSTPASSGGGLFGQNNANQASTATSSAAPASGLFGNATTGAATPAKPTFSLPSTTPAGAPLSMPPSPLEDCSATQVPKHRLEHLAFLEMEPNRPRLQLLLPSPAQLPQQHPVAYLGEVHSLEAALLLEDSLVLSQHLLPLPLPLLPLVDCLEQSLRVLPLLRLREEAQLLLPLRLPCSVLSLQLPQPRPQAQHHLVVSSAVAAQQLQLHPQIPRQRQPEDYLEPSPRQPQLLQQLLLQLQLQPLVVFLAALLSPLLKHLHQSLLVVYSELLLAVKQQARQLPPLQPLGHRRPLPPQHQALPLLRLAVCSARSQLQMPVRTQLNPRLPVPLPVL
ncbi:hypothetical protein NXS19_011836 [Fusarium pseudograminearum]|nr:hypothetical protein NXS19_011836 [Fusarium pseudograminearum]